MITMHGNNLVLCAGPLGCENSFLTFGKIPVYHCPYCGNDVLKVAATVEEHDRQIEDNAAYLARQRSRVS